MGCVAPGSPGAGGTPGDGSGGSTDRVTIPLWPTGQPELFETTPDGAGRSTGIGFWFDGAGSVITSDSAVDLSVPFDARLTGYTILAAPMPGSVLVGLWKVAFGAYPPTISHTITGATGITMTATMSAQSTDLTGWTTVLTSGDTLRCHVSAVATFSRLHVMLRAVKTASAVA